MVCCQYMESCVFVNKNERKHTEKINFFDGKSKHFLPFYHTNMFYPMTHSQVKHASFTKTKTIPPSVSPCICLNFMSYFGKTNLP